MKYDQIDLFIDRLLRIDSVAKRLLRLYHRAYSSRNPSFTMSDSVLCTEYNECFPKSGGCYDYKNLTLLESEDTGAKLFSLGFHRNCELLTNSADILLATNESYNDTIEAGHNDGLDSELTKILAELVEDANYFRDIHGIEYYRPYAGINGEDIVFSIDERKEDDRLLIDFISGDVSYQIFRNDGKPVKNPIPDSGIKIIENLLDDLEPWSYRMLECKTV